MSKRNRAICEAVTYEANGDNVAGETEGIDSNGGAREAALDPTQATSGRGANPLLARRRCMPQTPLLEFA